MPEDKNKSYDLHIDPDLLKIMPRPRLGGSDPAKVQPPTEESVDDSRIDNRSPEEIPEIDPETGEPKQAEQNKSHYLDIDPELLRIMPKPMMGGNMPVAPLEKTAFSPERVSPPSVQPAVERKAAGEHVKPDTITLMDTVKEQARVERELELGPKTCLGLPQHITSVLAYALGLISGLIVLLLEKNNDAVRRHAAQSVVVFGFQWIAVLGIKMIPGEAMRNGLLVAFNLTAVAAGGWLMYAAYKKRPADLPGIRPVVDVVARMR